MINELRNDSAAISHDRWYKQSKRLDRRRQGYAIGDIAKLKRLGWSPGLSSMNAVTLASKEILKDILQ